MADAVDEQAVTMALVVQRLDQQDGILKEIKAMVNDLNRYIKGSIDQRLVELDKAQALARQSVRANEIQGDELKTILNRQDMVIQETMTMVNDLNRHIRGAVDQRLAELDRMQTTNKESEMKLLDELKELVAANETRVDKLEMLTTRLVEMLNVFKWVGGIIGTAVVVWVVSQLLALIH